MPSSTLTHTIHVPNAHLGPATAHLAQHAGPVIRSRRDTVHVLHAHYGLDKLVTKPGDVGHLRMLQLLKSARLRSQLEYASVLVAQANAAEYAAVAAATAGADMDESESRDGEMEAKLQERQPQVKLVAPKPRNSLFDHMVRRDQAAGSLGGPRAAIGSNTSLDDDHGAKARTRVSVYADRRKSGNASAAARKYVVPPPPTGSLADSLNETVLDGSMDPLELQVPVLHLHNTRIVVAPVTPQTTEAARQVTPGRPSVLTPATNEWEPQSRRPTASGNPKTPKEILDTVFALWSKGHGRSKSRRSVLPVQQIKRQAPQAQEQAQLESRRKASMMRQDLTSALEKLSTPSSATSKSSASSKPETPDTPPNASLAVPPSDPPPPGKRKSVSIGRMMESAPVTDDVAIPRKPQTAPEATSLTLSRRLSLHMSISSAGEPTRSASAAMQGKARKPLPPVPTFPASGQTNLTKRPAVAKPIATAPVTPTRSPVDQSKLAASEKAQPRQPSISITDDAGPPQVQVLAPPKPSIAIEINVDDTPSPPSGPSPSSLFRHRMSMFSDAGSNDSIISVSPSIPDTPESPIKGIKPLNAAKLLAQRRGMIPSRSVVGESSSATDDTRRSSGHAPQPLLGSGPPSRVTSAGMVDLDPFQQTHRLSVIDPVSMDMASRTGSASPTGRSSARSPSRRARGISSGLPASAYLSLPSRAMHLIGSSSSYSHHRRRRRFRYLLSDLATPKHKGRLAAVTHLAERLGGGKELTAKLVRALCPPDDVLKPISGYFVGSVVNGNLNQYSAAGGGGPGSASASARTARLLREVEASLAAASRRGSASDDKPNRDPFHGVKSKVRAGWNWRERRAMRKVRHLLDGANRRKQSFFIAVARLAAGHEPKTEIPDVSIEASRRVSMFRARLGMGSDLGSMVFGHVPHQVRPAVKSPDVGKPQPGRPRTGSPKRVVVGENRSLVTKYPQTRERLKTDARRLKVNVTRDSSDVLCLGRDEKPLSGPSMWFPGALFGQMSQLSGPS